MIKRTLVLAMLVFSSAMLLTPGEASPRDGSEQTSDELLRLLDQFARAWNRHDVEALMSMMTEDGVYEASSGPDVNGQRFEGESAVRAAYEAIFERFHDAHWGNAEHFVSGNRGYSQWTFTGTTADGVRIEVNGCDLFTFRDGKIAVKSSFRKNRS